MGSFKPFLPNETQDALPEGAEGDFLMPICMPDAEVMVGEDLAVLVLTTVEGQRVGVPIGTRALAGLHAAIGEALRMLQTPEGGSVQ